MLIWIGFLFCYCRGPARFEGDRPRFGDREGYRGGPPRGPGGFGDKAGAPEGFQPSFRVIISFIISLYVTGYNHKVLASQMTFWDWEKLWNPVL